MLSLGWNDMYIWVSLAWCLMLFPKGVIPKGWFRRSGGP